jgi:hypothetical protein
MNVGHRRRVHESIRYLIETIFFTIDAGKISMEGKGINVNGGITFFCEMITADFSPLTATAVFPPPVAPFIAYSV